jgi:type I restriction enzyme S subunit
LFELHSIPAFDAGRPALLHGKQIGSSKQIVQPSDVMISKIVPHIRRSSVVGPSSGTRQIASGEWIVFRSERVFPHYLRHVLVSDLFHSKFMATVSGVGGSLLRARPAEVAKIKVPLPPLPEQRRIAKILDKADALRAKRREAIAKLDQLLQSVFLEMFGDPSTNARGWRVSTIGDECEVGSGSTPSRQVEAYFEGNIPWVKSTEVNWGTIVETGERVSESGQKAARLRLYPAKTVVVALYGQGTTRGKCALLGIPATMNQACSGISPSKTVNPIYLFHYLRRCYERLRGESRGGNQENLNLGILKSFGLPVPPLELQERFARVVAKWDAQNYELFQGADHMDRLFSSLQQRAFAGTL